MKLKKKSEMIDNHALWKHLTLNVRKDNEQTKQLKLTKNEMTNSKTAELLSLIKIKSI